MGRKNRSNRAQSTCYSRADTLASPAHWLQCPGCQQGHNSYRPKRKESFAQRGNKRRNWQKSGINRKRVGKVGQKVCTYWRDGGGCKEPSRKASGNPARHNTCTQSRGQALALEGQSGQGMWEEIEGKASYPLRGASAPRRGLREASCWWAHKVLGHLPGAS
jgi:hypothetical protein